MIERRIVQCHGHVASCGICYTRAFTWLWDRDLRERICAECAPHSAIAERFLAHAKIVRPPSPLDYRPNGTPLIHPFSPTL